MAMAEEDIPFPSLLSVNQALESGLPDGLHVLPIGSFRFMTRPVETYFHKFWHFPEFNPVSSALLKHLHSSKSQVVTDTG